MLGLSTQDYGIQQGDDGVFFPGRCANITLANGTKVGAMGVLHPHVLSKYELTNPISILELHIEPMLK